MRGFIWTDELSERVSRERGYCQPADVLTWACITVVPLILAAVIGFVLWL